MIPAPTNARDLIAQLVAVLEQILVAHGDQMADATARWELVNAANAYLLVTAMSPDEDAKGGQ